MKKIFGHTTGLKAKQIQRLENLYRRRVMPEYIVSPELARDMGRLSHEIQRQIGLLIDRSGKLTHVILGDRRQITIPDLSAYRVAPGRLKGLRCVHTHVDAGTLDQDDFSDLALLRLDLIAAITLSDEGLPQHIYSAHIKPGETAGAYEVMPPLTVSGLNVDCANLVKALENEIARFGALLDADFSHERALLISVTTAARQTAVESLEELAELADSSGVHVVDSVLQRRKKVDSRFLMGRGKLAEITIAALHRGITLLVFDQELNPSQIRAITDRTELKVIDRTQLILDIFAQRAQTREGKLQVELAQLKYLLPRLVVKNTAMSRLTGGIGGRGPGETKLEISRRRIRDRIRRLEKSLGQVKKHRVQQKARRSKRSLPAVSIIGYTNAGKSTLLNTLTNSDVLAENRLFATLDPSSRRLRFPRETEVIISDTVGFIRDLPKELMVAFRATLEELAGADLLLHMIDVSNPRYVNQIRSVQQTLEDLDFQSLPVVNVLNKIDLIDKETVSHLAERYDGVPISARKKETLGPLIERVESLVLAGRQSV
jgi:GTP-binding protein HflX